LPILQQVNTQLVREFQKAAFLSRIPKGQDLFLEGNQVEAIALLISGVVRVYKIGETGQEITLYRFGNGQGCILTANAILSQKTFPAIATVEKEAQAVMIPADTFRDWVVRYDLLSQRLSAVLGIVEEIAFRRMDARVASLLLARAQTQNPGESLIRKLHQSLEVHGR
jgi:CRP/FNR family transcriptional regulator